MTRFLLKAAYTPDGIKGLLKVGGTNRKEAVDKMLKELGGRLECFYYGFGDNDIYTIGEVPDAISVAALALTINSCGLVTCSVTILMAAEDIDKAARISVNYRMPGN